MIFATVGTQLPFDRLIRGLDEWAGRNPQAEVFAQIGRSSYEPRHLRWERAIPEKRFREFLDNCDAVVAHAGMGTIISGFERGKRVIVMPRRTEFGEHRNDHQLATAERLSHLGGLEIVHDRVELGHALDAARDSHADNGEAEVLAAFANPELVSRIRSFAGLGEQ